METFICISRSGPHSSYSYNVLNGVSSCFQMTPCMVCGCSHASAQGHAGRGEVSHLLPFEFSQMTPSLCLRRCTGTPTSSCFSGSVPHRRCGTVGLRPAVTLQRMERFLSGTGFTQRAQGGLCSPPSVLSWILLEKENPAVMVGAQLPLRCMEMLPILDRWQGRVLYEAIFKLQAVEMTILTFL